MTGEVTGATAQGPGEVRFQELLRKAVEVKGSDLHLKIGLPPVVRLHDELRLLSQRYAALATEEIKSICNDIIPPRLKPLFEAGKEIDMAYTFAGVGRFRLNIYRYRSQIGMVARFIPFDVPTLAQLGMPDILQKLALFPRGLILVTGSTGSGKSSTLASMLNQWNQVQSGHIITIEDPVEYLIRDRKSIITQREVGLDTESFTSGLKNALRQDPDVIMIGEIRDQETLRTALTAAETGHLVLSTLHTKDAVETVNRVLGIFEPQQEREIRVQFATTLIGIISQRLIPRAPGPDGKSRGLVPAVEILINSGRIRDCLQDSHRAPQIREAIEAGAEMYGMQSFDQHLAKLLAAGEITKETAMQNATNPADFDLKLRGIQQSDEGRWGNVDESKVQSVRLGTKSLELENPKPPKRK